MEPQELHDYRDHLLDALEDQPRRIREEHPTRLQVFVNHECVGSLDCTTSDARYSFASRERSIQNIELRSEAGTLIGGLSAPEAGMKHARIPLDRGSVTIQIQNKVDGGSAQFGFQSAPSLWTQLAGAVSWSTGAERAQVRPTWASSYAFAQVVLAVAVVGLLADRVPDWVGADRATALFQEQRTSQQAIQEQFTRLEARMNQLADNQLAVLTSTKGEKEELTQLTKHIETMSQSQQKLSTQLVDTQEELQTVKNGVVDEVQNGVRVAFHKAEADQQLVRQELQAVKSVNDTLVKQVAVLEGKNRELHARLALATIEIAKATTAPKSSAVARSEAPKENTPQVQLAEARRDADPQAFMFWVSFQDGTPEKSIEDLIQEIKGTKKGPINSGWYPVEVTLPKPEPPDRFLESIKRAKIVKAVATNKVFPPAQ